MTDFAWRHDGDNPLRTFHSIWSQHPAYYDAQGYAETRARETGNRYFVVGIPNHDPPLIAVRPESDPAYTDGIDPDNPNEITLAIVDDHGTTFPVPQVAPVTTRRQPDGYWSLWVGGRRILADESFAVCDNVARAYLYQPGANLEAYEIAANIHRSAE